MSAPAILFVTPLYPLTGTAQITVPQAEAGPHRPEPALAAGAYDPQGSLPHKYFKKEGRKKENVKFPSHQEGLDTEFQHRGLLGVKGD